MSDLEYINNGHKNETIDFFGTDTKKLYDENLKIQPLDWEYREKHVSYHFNEQGFRSKYNFDNFADKDCVILLGCSSVVGVGLSEQDTLCTKLEEELGIPVLNFGVSGSSIDVSIYNSAIIKERHKKIKALIHGWTNVDRFLSFGAEGYPVHNGPWTQTEVALSYYKHFIVGSEYHHKHKRNVFSKMWLNTPLYEFTFFDNTKEIFDCDIFHYTDRARDLANNGSHPGKEIISIVANKIKNKIKIN